MPQCIECERNWTPTSANADGTCPACGGELRSPLATEPVEDGDEEPKRRAPWHFKVLVAAAALYLGWRAVQGVDWVVHHL